MSLSSVQKQSIALEVIKILVAKFISFPETGSSVRNAPFHDAFLRAFADKFSQMNIDSRSLISLSSWFHGLNTSLGQSFFENTANIICGGEKKEWTSGRNGTLQISRTEKDQINDIMTQLSNATRTPNLENEWRLINSSQGTNMVNALDFAADVFFEDDESVTAIEMKSVQPNSGEMRGEKQKILEGKSALQRLYPGKQVNFFIGFPFDPTLDTSDCGSVCRFDKTRFMQSLINGSKFFDPCEILLASELWDRLSSEENTMEAILEIINGIASVDFENELEILKSYRITDNSSPVEIMQRWCIYSETVFVQKKNRLLKIAKSDTTLSRYLNQSCFKSDGKYNTIRNDYVASKL